MSKGRNSNSKLQPITEEQIRAKAREIWQSRNRQPGSPEADWNQAVEELEAERSLIKRIQRKTRLRIQRFWNWTGFHEKKGWDFLQLLIVPIVLASVGFALNQFAQESESYRQSQIKAREQSLAARKEKQEQILADTKAKQEVLIQYLDQMASLLHQDLPKSSFGSEAFTIAQYKTVTALQSLDPKRQQAVIQFLEAANLNLLDKGKGLLYKARMAKVDFRGADLSGCTIMNAELRLSRLSKIDLSGCTLKSSVFNGSDLAKAKLGGANLSSAKLISTGLVDSDLRIVSLVKANLTEANLTKANLTEANLSQATLGAWVKPITGDRFTGANLTEANLTKANLTEAKLGAIVELAGATLTRANLTRANLTRANLFRADLTGANLTEANLIDAEDWTDAQIATAKLCKTMLPIGSALDPDRDCKEMSSPTN